MRAQLLPLLMLVACGGPTTDVDAGSGGRDAAGAMDSSAPPVEAGLDGGVDGAMNDGAMIDGATNDGATNDGARLDGGRADAGDAARVDGGGGVADGCAFDGWCWVYPTPFGTPLNDVWGATPDDVWAVGPRGFIAHFDGLAWAVVPSPATDSDLRAVHGSGPDRVFAVGDGGTILRWDGAAWRHERSPTELDLHDVFIASDTDGWAVGADRVRVRWDGIGWSVYDTEPTFGSWTAVWGAAPDDVWIGSSRGGFQRWDGAEWRRVDGLVLSYSIDAIWGTGVDDVWAASTEASHRVARWDGSAWQAVRVPETPTSIWTTTLGGRSADDVWVLGHYGRAHWDGSAFTVVDSHSSSDEAPGAVHLFATDGWAVGGSGRIFRNVGGLTWTLAAGALDRRADFQSVASASGGGVFLASLDGLWRADAAGVARLAGGVRAVKVVEAAPGDVWLSGGTGSHAEVWRWDGASLTPVESEWFSFRAIHDLWASGPDDVYLAASRGAILRWDGSTVSRVRDGGATGATVSAIDGVDATDVFAVTQRGEVLRGSGTTWSVIASDPGVWWTSVRALAADDVWIGGGGATLWHWDGVGWTPAEVPDIQRPWNRGNSPYIVDIVGDARTGLTAFTDQHHVLRFTGGRWTRDRSLPVRPGRAAVDAEGAVWVAAGGNVVRRP